MGLAGSKIRFLGQILRKPCVRSRGQIFGPIHRMFALMKSHTSLKIGYVLSKTSSLYQILEKLCLCCRGHTFSLKSRNLVRIFALIKSWMSSNMGYVWPKTRSLGQILEKPCVRFRGHIFSPILMKLGQSVCINELLTH